MATNYERRKAKERAAAEAATKPTEEFDGVAYDMVYDPEARVYHRFEVEYNTKTGAARIRNKTIATTSQPVAIQKMHELFTRKLLKLSYT